MEKYCLCDELNDYDFYDLGADYLWVVYHYENGFYDGDGELVAFDGENLHIFGLGHCSCYGPLDGCGSGETISKEKYLASDNVLDADSKYGDVREKVLELLTQ